MKMVILIALIVFAFFGLMGAVADSSKEVRTNCTAIFIASVFAIVILYIWG